MKDNLTDEQYKKLKSYRVLRPLEYSGSINGDYGYEINGVKSSNSYVSKSGAERAMHREVDKILSD